MSENDIQAELNDDLLTTRGEKRSQHDDEQHQMRERSYGAFSCIIQPPSAADPTQLASFANGVLTVTVPKVAAQQQAHRTRSRTLAPRSRPGTFFLLGQAECQPDQFPTICEPRTVPLPQVDVVPDGAFRRQVLGNVVHWHPVEST